MARNCGFISTWGIILTSLIIRADATACIGAGHIMRCLSLALAAKKRDMDVAIVGEITISWVLTRIKDEGIPFYAVEQSAARSENKAEFIEQLQLPCFPLDNCWVVLDGYHFDLKCQKSIRAAGFKLLVLDDYCHLPSYCCDVLLNQNLGSASLSYQGAVGKSLLGAEFALLRPEFSAARDVLQPRIAPCVEHVLVNLGGGNRLEALLALSYLLHFADFACCRFTVILGESPLALARCLFEFAADRTEFLYKISDACLVMSSADLVITAAGSSCWELCCLGVPFVTVILGADQRMSAKKLDEAGIAPTLGEIADLPDIAKDKLPPVVREVLASAEKRREMSELGRRLVSGMGAERVLEEMQFYKKTIREATYDDRYFIWSIFGDVITRSGYCFIPGSMTFVQFTEWYTDILSDKNSLFFIVQNDYNLPCGYIRLHVKDGVGEISIALSVEYKFQGYGPRAISECCAIALSEFADITLISLIRIDNPVSIKAFEKAGFSRRSEVVVEHHRAVRMEYTKS